MGKLMQEGLPFLGCRNDGNSQWNGGTPMLIGSKNASAHHTHTTTHMGHAHLIAVRVLVWKRHQRRRVRKLDLQ